MSSGGRTVPEVLHDIFGNLQDIVRSEVKLAKTELREEFAKIKRATLIIVLSALIAIIGFCFLLVAVLFGLSQVMQLWAAVLLLAVILLGAGMIGMSAGTRWLNRRIQLAPGATASVKESISWARQQTK